MSALGWVLVVAGALLIVSVINQSYGPAWDAIKEGVGA